MSRATQAREDLLAESRRRYDLKRAINWYSRASFLYRLLDEACRPESIGLMYSYRSVIGDLYEQLQHLPRPDSEITVFRGQLMTPDELEKLKLNIGQTVFTNSFLSPTYDEQVAVASVALECADHCTNPSYSFTDPIQLKVINLMLALQTTANTQMKRTRYIPLEYSRIRRMH